MTLKPASQDSFRSGAGRVSVGRDARRRPDVRAARSRSDRGAEGQRSRQSTTPNATRSPGRRPMAHCTGELQEAVFAEAPDADKVAALQQQLVQAQSARLAKRIAIEQQIAQILTAEQRAQVRERLARQPAAGCAVSRDGSSKPRTEKVSGPGRREAQPGHRRLASRLTAWPVGPVRAPSFKAPGRLDHRVRMANKRHASPPLVRVRVDSRPADRRW